MQQVPPSKPSSRHTESDSTPIHEEEEDGDEINEYDSLNQAAAAAATTTTTQSMGPPTSLPQRKFKPSALQSQISAMKPIKLNTNIDINDRSLYMGGEIGGNDEHVALDTDSKMDV